ncbi:unnamed protein product [Didymodactylos carnosus]|uniref:phenylalanine--tRNA ligase n=1 Tax=Didymodactylos carnosus TaxID=1234261 RepID=A0A814UKR3_9BILA|nr:unnamed protein product [Didymodactylos carnosus]CAF1175363.1 unnamed protein product [Didymodactylos carnosus]CAF3611523.1 unnamed protein product [Didymodactylos carnosus]CAF3939416.1 unnamed protein product [Didymodactylos carnosus]
MAETLISDLFLRKLTMSESSYTTKKPLTSSDLQEDILSDLKYSDELNTWTYATKNNLDHQLVIGCIRSIQSIGDIITVEQQTSKFVAPTDEGKLIIENGSYEYRLYQAVPDTGIEHEALMQLPNAAIGFNKAMSNKWFKLDKSIVRKNKTDVTDEVQSLLKSIQSMELKDNQKEISDLKKRKLVEDIVINYLIVKKGPGFTTTVTKGEADLTADMIQKFTEMPTNNYVESSFWNFDALFTPQQHPARDAHDTFFLSDPAKSVDLPMEYLEKVKQVHSTGAFGSIGYQYNWQLEEAQKNVLRTHTTAVSARMLYKLAQNKPFTPAKYFSIDKVFRNENLDATHLAEFHQIEGLVADYKLTLGDLIGLLYEFFRKLGMTKLRFKPAYNPYTEPSMEIFSYHEGLKKWIEVGNSGVFRPEMLLAMGFPEEVSVIAWGLSLERPTMILYGIDNIRDLIGPKVNLEMCRENPLCRIMSTSDVYAVRGGKLELKGNVLKKKKHKSKKRKHGGNESDEGDDEDFVKHAGWWRTKQFVDIQGSIAIEFGENTYVHSLDNGLFTIGPPRDFGDGPDQREILTAIRITENKIALKSGFGKYVAVNKNGLLVGRSDAIGPAEYFEPVFENGQLALSASNNKFIRVNDEGDLIATDEKAADENFINIRSCAKREHINEKRRKLLPEEEQPTNVKDVEVNYVKKFQKFQDKRMRVNQGDTKNLVKARGDGTLHEVLLDRREEMKSDRYCK